MLESVGVAWVARAELVRPLVLAPRPVLYPAFKRSLDLTLALIGVLLLAPLLLLTALLIKLEDGGSVLFAQTRVGRGGRRFRFYKFRSMRVTAEAERAALLAQTGHQGVRFKLQADPRITRVGRWIRRFSIDELPQLLNVIKGDLSLVGPRPAIPEEVERYGPVELRRLDVEQGLTCLWQVEGRSLLPFEKQVQLDLEYIRRRGLLFDLILIARTIPAVLSGRGAF